MPEKIGLNQGEALRCSMARCGRGRLTVLVAPATLVFYGMTLFNAGKFTLDEVRYLGICEMILGLVAAIYIGYGLLFWAIGFGVLHIIYGAVMWWKYER